MNNNKKLAAAGLTVAALAWSTLSAAANVANVVNAANAANAGAGAEATAGANTGANAAEAAALQVRGWAAACFVCHGHDGRAPAGSPVPGLAGKPQSYLVAQMLAFRSGKRQATVMDQIARGYSDAQIVAIAGWFAAVR